MKSLVYETPVNSEEELVARIAVAAGDISATPGVFQRVRQSLQHRYEICIEQHGRNFEHLF